MDILCTKLQNFTLDRNTLDFVVKEGARKTATCCNELVDPATIYKDVVTVLLHGVGIVSDSRQDAKMDPLIGNVVACMRQKDIQELEEANISDDSFLLVDNPIMDKSAAPEKHDFDTSATMLDTPQDLRNLLDRYNLPKRVTRTSVKVLQAERVHQLAKEIKAIYPGFESEHLKITHSKSGRPTKEDWIDAIVAMAKKSK